MDFNECMRVIQSNDGGIRIVGNRIKSNPIKQHYENEFPSQAPVEYVNLEGNSAIHTTKYFEVNVKVVEGHGFY